jgi:hypothetical protein
MKVTEHENQREIFGDFHKVPYFILHCFICCPSKLNCVENAGIEPGCLATLLWLENNKKTVIN